MARRIETATLNRGSGADRHDPRDSEDPRTRSTTDPNRTVERAVAHSETRPDTAIEALMQCAPGVDPLPSRDELLPLRDILQDAIERLTAREQWIFDALTTRKLSLRQCAAELALSKTHVQRERDIIHMKLRTILIESQEIREYLT